MAESESSALANRGTRFDDEVAMAEMGNVGSSRQGNHSGQWGLASVLLGSVVLLLFPMMLALMLSSMVAMVWDDANESQDVDLGVLTTYVCVFGIAGVAGFAVFCGLIGLASALFRRQSFGLSLAGTFTAVVALAMAGVLVLIMFRVVEWTRDYQKTHYDFKGQKIQTPHQNLPLFR
jgi:hypothetical protein